MAKHNSIIGDNIKRYRKSEGIKKREDLAEKLYISDSSLRDYENGTIPPEDRRKLLAQEMGIAVHQLEYILDFEKNEYSKFIKKDIAELLEDKDPDWLLNSYSEVHKNWFPILSSSLSLNSPLFKFVFDKHVESILQIVANDDFWEYIDCFVYLYDLSYKKEHFIESKANILTLLALYWNVIGHRGLSLKGSMADIHKVFRKRKSNEVSEKEKMFIEKYSEEIVDALNVLSLSDEYKEFYIYYMALAKIIYLCNSEYFGSDYENSYSKGIKELYILIESNNRFAINARKSAENFLSAIFYK